MSHETPTFKTRAAGLPGLLLLTASLCAAQALAQEAGKAPEPAGQDEEVVTVRSQLVNIDVVARDGKGKFVTDLKAEDFAVVETGVPQRVVFFDPPLARGEGTATGQADATALETSRARRGRPR